MRPVRTEHCNLTYVGPPGVGDLHAERIRPGIVRSVWHLTAQERAAVASGANIALAVFTEPHPPVGLSVTDEAGVGEDAPEVLARLEELKADPPEAPAPA